MTPDPHLAEAANMAGLLARATLLILSAWAGAAALRQAGASAAARHTAWLLGIVALLALTLLRWIAPALPIPIPVAPAGGSEAAAPLAAGPAAAPPAPGPQPPGWDWATILLAAYAAGAMALLLRVAAGRWRLARLWRAAAAPAAGDAWGILLTHLAGEMGLARPVALRFSPERIVPMTWGTLAPRLLLPAEAALWPAEQRRLVLLHELAHVARRDSLSRSAASLVCALYWFHPGAWFAARQLRIEQEHAADDRVLTTGGCPQAYARSLLCLAREMSGSAEPVLAATMAGTCQLERRLVCITRPLRRDLPTSAFVAWSAMVGTIATILAATAVPVRATPGAIARIGGTPPPARTGAESSETRPAAAADGSEETAEPEALPAAVFAADRRGPAGRPASADGPSRETVPASRERDAGGDGASPAGEAAASPSPTARGSADQLRDYGWTLRRAEPKVPLGAVTIAARPPRLGGAAASPGGSGERAHAPGWARFVPHLTRHGTLPQSLPLSSNGTLMLSLSTNPVEP